MSELCGGYRRNFKSAAPAFSLSFDNNKLAYELFHVPASEGLIRSNGMAPPTEPQKPFRDLGLPTEVLDWRK
jgi:hypothetical protein